MLLLRIPSEVLQMKQYQHTKKDSAERVGFYIALTVCIAAVGLAIWSAYSTLSEPEESGGSYFASLSSATAPAAQPMTGVTESPTSAPTAAATAQPTENPTEPATEAHTFARYEGATQPRTEDAEMDADVSSLQAVLRVTDSLAYPVKSRSVLKQYSEDAVYSKTMRDYRAHTGCDFAAEAGESVYAMCSGTVKDISVSELYGVIAEIACNGFSVYYCGLDPDVSVMKGDTVSTGDTIGAAAQVPCECEDPAHIHVEIRVGNRLIDPLSVINNNS